jgi:uncharacterized repeat protein (TIGR02543 family)
VLKGLADPHSLGGESIQDRGPAMLETRRHPAARTLAAVIVGALLAVAAVVLLPAAARADTTVVDGITYTYTPGSGEAAATSYTGSGGAVTIPATVSAGGQDYAVTSVGANAFTGKALTAVAFPGSLRTIGDQAFYNNVTLATAPIPSGVTTIGQRAFYLTGLTELTLPEGVVSVGAYAFGQSAIRTVSLPRSLTTLSDWLFYMNPIETISIPDTVTSIGDRAFQDSRLTEVVIPDSVTSIGGQAFFRARLTSVTIGSGVQSIAGYAFSENSSLSRVTFRGNAPTMTVSQALGDPFGKNLELKLYYAQGATGFPTPWWNGYSTVALMPATVTFAANGGAGAMAPQTSSLPTALAANAFTYTGHSFDGWNTAPDGSGIAYRDGAVFPFTAAATLYAQWAPISYTVTFDSAGGTGVSPQSVEYGGFATAPTPPTRAGYTFAGWLSGGEPFDFTTPITADLTLTAGWVALPVYTVTFVPNGGTGTMAPESSYEPTALSTLAYSRTGYTFTGWNTAADGTGFAYADGAVYPFTADATLYAQWMQIILTVSFDSAGGSPVPSQEVAYDGTATRPADPVRAGYAFEGWFAPDAGMPFPFATPITESLTLTANWAALPVFTVTFDANGGAGEMAPESAYEPTALTANAFARTGYTFAGWNTAPDGSGTSYADAAVYAFAADATLYARWAQILTLPSLSAGVSDAGGRMTVTVTGSGFTPGEPVIVVLHSDPVVLGTLVADAAGNVSGSFTIPAGTPAGAHTVVATGTLSGVQASVAIVVPADPAALAATGADPFPALGWGTAAVLLGALALLLRRRRAV